MPVGVYSSNMAWEKVPTLLKSPLYRQKPNNNCFRVPIHFAANRFTFEKFPPPPPLLHPNMYCTTKGSCTGRQKNQLVNFEKKKHKSETTDLCSCFSKSNNQIVPTFFPEYHTTVEPNTKHYFFLDFFFR